MLTISFLVFIGCNDAKYQQELNDIDSLITVVDSLHQKLIGLNIDTINILIDETEGSLSVLRAYTPDKNKQEYLTKISYCGSVNKQLGRFIGSYSHYQKELTMSGEQLKSLRFDVENNLLKDTMVQKYLNDEQRILSSLGLKFENSINNMNEKKQFYMEIRESILTYTDSIKTIQQDNIEY